jgi:tetratricopeptide (TPR) repeat protein
MTSFSRVCGVVLILMGMAASAMAADTQEQRRTAAARLNNLGVALLNQQDMAQAITKFEAALKEDPTLAVAEMNRGIALLAESKLPDAEKALRHASTMAPKDAQVWYALGLVLKEQGRDEDSLPAFKKAVELAPEDADGHYWLGATYLKLRQYEAAVPEFEAALRINHLHASAEFGLSRALQRMGKMEEARPHLRTFERITREKLAAAMGNGYGEQGRLSNARDIRLEEPPVGPMIPVTLMPQALGPAKGGSGGACLLDVDGDSRPDLIVLVGGDSALQVYLNKKDGFQLAAAETFGLALKGQAISCAVGDFDGDGRADLAVAMDDRLVLFRNASNGHFTDVTKTAGLEQLNQPAGLLWVDYDHDGDLDLFVTGRSTGTDKTANILWRNNGNGTFTQWTSQTGLGGNTPTVGAALSDLNNDRAVDLLVTGSGQAPTFYSNQREGPFAAQPLVDAALPPTVGIAIVDFNKDGWMDVALTHAGAPGVSLWKNVDGKRFERMPLPLTAKQGWGVAALDIDNDGWIDLAFAVETSRGSEVRVLRNMGGKEFTDVSSALGLEKATLSNARSLIAADLDGDGAADLLVTQENAAPVFLRNQGGNRNHSLRITLAGLVDNKSGIGTKVEVFADGLWQKFEVGGSSAYLGQGSTQIVAGLGQQDKADIVRMLWPTGVLQDEINIASDKPAAITQLERRGSSCPTLFAWNGKEYSFISDVIGAAVVGHWVSPTEKNLADPDEWVKIDGSQLKEKDGAFSLRFGEPMEEVNFLDQVRLVAVDHPESSEVYPNERFLSAPPFPDGKVIETSAPRAVAGAWDNEGRDVRQELSARDHRYVRDFKNLSFAGFANSHTLTLDLGEWSPAAPLRMYMYGFIEYFMASSMYSAWQAGIDPVAPYVEALMPDGSWKRVVDDMGFPAGLPRMIVVDLTGKLPPGTRNIRITTNLQIYWDQILVDNGAENQTFRTTELPLLSANLDFRGYPQQVDGEAPGDLTYRYNTVSKTGPFARERGYYTKYGEVGELLKSAEDHYVIFGSGEDLDLEFGATSLPPLPQGWKRDYFFYANGFVKDMDFYEASAFTVGELPFHKMKTYPYAVDEHYPDDDATWEYRLKWNDRFDSGQNKAAGYRFQYKPRQE